MKVFFYVFIGLSALFVSPLFGQDSIPYTTDSALVVIPDSVQQDTVYQNFIADIIIDKAREFMGVRYAMGGMSHSGMDCSGLVCTSFAAIDFKLPHSSGQLAQMGSYIEVENLMAGDLIFFQNRNKTGIGHVAMVSKVENDNIYIIHATSSNGVMEEILQNNPYFMQRWVYNKRIIE